MAAATQPFRISLSASRNFPRWLAESGGSIAFTTYQTGKLFLVGIGPDGRLAVTARSFPRAMGLAVSADASRIAVATEHHVRCFERTDTSDHHDALYAPRVSWITGDIDVHDMGWGTDDRPVFVNTLFGCIATVSDRHNFRPLWKPPFLSRLAAEDRCHLNGMAMEDGRPRYASAVSRSDIADGWRDRRADGGVLIDVSTNQILTHGLSMPHSPRLYRDRLWLLDAGTGRFGHVDRATGTFEEVAFCPGFARGLGFLGKYAIIGLSLPRDTRSFQGLELDEGLRRRDVDPRCGLAVIDLDTGDMTEWLRIEGEVRELFDVATLPGVRCPSAVAADEVGPGFAIDPIAHMAV